MRPWLLAFAACCMFTTSASATIIQTGNDLVTACSDYVARSAREDNNASRAPHPCRSFLQGYFVSLIERENARQNALVRGLPYSSKDQCVRLPGFLSFREMAERLISYAQNNPQALAGPAATLAQRTVERDFPCPTARTR